MSISRVYGENLAKSIQQKPLQKSWEVPENRSIGQRPPAKPARDALPMADPAMVPKPMMSKPAMRPLSRPCRMARLRASNIRMGQPLVLQSGSEATVRILISYTAINGAGRLFNGAFRSRAIICFPHVLADVELEKRFVYVQRGHQPVQDIHLSVHFLICAIRQDIHLQFLRTLHRHNHS